MERLAQLTMQASSPWWVTWHVVKSCRCFCQWQRRTKTHLRACGVDSPWFSSSEVRGRTEGMNLAICVLSGTHPFLQLLTAIWKKSQFKTLSPTEPASLRYKHGNESNLSTKTIPREAYILCKSLNTKDFPFQKFDCAHSIPKLFEIVSHSA